MISTDDKHDYGSFRCVECGEEKGKDELEPGFSETCSECVNELFDEDTDDEEEGE